MPRRAIAVWLLGLVVCLPLWAAPDDPAQEARAVVESQSRFAIDLYAKLRAGDGNLLVSPYSIASALGMVSAGARGTTLDELTRALHLPPQKVLHPSAAAQVRALEARSADERQPSLSVANRLWVQEKLDLEAPFVDTLKRHYRAGLETTDFAGDPEVSRLTVNRWVWLRTGKRIQELMPRGSVTVDTRAVLANAVHFRGEWEVPMRRSTGPFYLAPGRKVDVPTAGARAAFAVLNEKDVSAAELPYRGGAFGMVVLLPAEGVGLAALEKRLTYEHLTRLLKGLSAARPRDLRLRLPMFAFSSDFKLRQALESMNVVTLFSRSANLRGMTRQPVALGDVYHKATIHVDEKGTEAAAATGASIIALSVSGGTFTVDRPFVFLIRHRPTNTLLFLGRVTGPTRR